MKNIHVLPTDKRSRLHKAFEKTFILSTEPTYANDLYKSVPHNIYITSNEEIKEDYVIAYGVVIKVMMFDKETLYFVNGTKAKREDCKKIILTDNKDLIKDGVQAIDDEFLEWFVKNPSCEEVEVMPIGFEDREDYLIIIPKEETKQETLEEAAEKLTNDFPALEVRFNMSNEEIYGWFLEALQKGAKWQQERMYSEEEVIKILLSRNADLGIIGKTSAVVEFIKQFKKK